MYQAYRDEEQRAENLRSLDADDQVTRFGPGAMWEVGRVARQQGITNALVIVDRALAASPASHVVHNSLSEAGIRFVDWAGARPTPQYSDVADALEAVAGTDCDGVISLGGGSAIDVAKAVALLGQNGGDLHDWAHGSATARSVWPHIAVPTTAGTGAETSSYVFLLAAPGQEHTILHHDVLRPCAAVIDPLAHLSMPPRVTAATGMNALAGAIEAYLSPAAMPASDESALRAVGLIAEHLTRAVEDGHDLPARSAMAEAAYMAGRAFSTAGLGIVDSMSLVVSSLFNIGHSTANAILLPHVMAHLAPQVTNRMLTLGDALSAAGHYTPPDESAIKAVRDIRARVGLPANLATFGVTWDDLYLMGDHMVNHPFAKRSARPLDPDSVASIFTDAIGVPSAAPHGRPPRPSVSPRAAVART